MASSSSRPSDPTVAQDARLGQQTSSRLPSTITRSMSRRSSLALSNATPTTVPSTSKHSLPAARRVGVSATTSSSSSSTTKTMPRTRSSTSIASRSSTFTGKSAVTNLTTSRARRVLSETSSSFNQPSSNISAVKRSASASIASIRSPPRQGARRYSRAEAGGLTGFGVVKAGPRVVSPVKMERETGMSRLGGAGVEGGGNNVNDPYSTAFQRPMFSFERTQTKPSESQPPISIKRDASFAIREDRSTTLTSDDDELYLRSPRKAVVPLSSPKPSSSASNQPSSYEQRSTFISSPTKRRLVQGDENMDLDPTVTIPIRPSSPVRGALSPRTLLRSGGNVPSQTLRRTKPSRKIEEVDSSSDSEEDEFDFLSPRKKAKLPSSTTLRTVPRSAPTSISRNDGPPSRIGRARTSTGSSLAPSSSTLASKTIDRSQLLRSPPPKKPVTQPLSSSSSTTARPLPASAPMQRNAGGRAFPLPSSLPPVSLVPAQPRQPIVSKSSSRSLPPPRSVTNSRPIASPSSFTVPEPPSHSAPTSTAASLSRLPRRISNEHQSFDLSAMPPPPPPAAPSTLLARSTSPTFPEPSSVSLMSIDESQETSFSNAGDLSTMSTTSVRSEETAKRLANLQNMLSRLQMPRRSVGGTGESADSRRSSMASENSSNLDRDELVPLAPPGPSDSRRSSLSSTRQRGPSVSRLPSAIPSRPRGGIVDTSASRNSSFSRPSISSGGGPITTSRRISSSFLPSQSFDMSSSTTMSDISVVADESATEVFSEPTIKVSDNQTSSSASSVLNGVVAFVDVRTGEGDDSGMIFVDMLKGMGARVTTRPSSLTTHVIFKAGKPSTLQYVRSCVRPPKVVGIAWVVRCAEIGQKVDEKAFAVVEEKKEMEKENSLFAIGAGKTAPAQKRRRSMEPKALAALNSSSNFSGSTNPALKASIAASLERARLRSLQFQPKIGSPLAKRVFVMPDMDDNEPDDVEEEM